MNDTLGITGLLPMAALALAFLAPLLLLATTWPRSTCACGLCSALRDVAIFCLIGVNTLLSASTLAATQSGDPAPMAEATPEAASAPQTPETESPSADVVKPSVGSGKPQDAAAITSEPVIDASLDTIEIPPGRPAWINQSPNLVDRIQTISIASGPYALEKQARRALDTALVQATTEYITDQLGLEAAKVIRYDASTLKKRFVKPENIYHDVARYSVGPMHEYFALLELDRDFRKELDRRWKKVQASERVTNTGMAAAASLIGLATVFTVFRFRCRKHTA